MKHLAIIGYVVFALIAAGCHKAEATSEEVKPETEKHECHCEAKLVGPVWKPGTLCAKGEVSQGHGVNPKGQMVSGCYKLESKCECP